MCCYMKRLYRTLTLKQIGRHNVESAQIFVVETYQGIYHT